MVKQNGFLIQIVCLTIAPAFMAAGLYLTLSRIVMTFGPENSRIAPLSYPRIFIPYDVVSLLLAETYARVEGVQRQSGQDDHDTLQPNEQILVLDQRAGPSFAQLDNTVDRANENAERCKRKGNEEGSEC